MDPSSTHAHKVAAHLLQTGLSQTSMRRLAEVAETSGRMLTYHFTSKSGLLKAALTLCAQALEDELDDAVERQGGDIGLANVVAVLTHPVMLPYLRLWQDMVTATAAGDTAIEAVTQDIARSLRDWLRATLPALSEGEAALVMAGVDGIAQLRLVGLEEEAEQARLTLASLFPHAR